MAGNNTFKLPAFMTSTAKKKDEEEQSTGITNPVHSSNYMVPSFMRSQTTSVVSETPAPVSVVARNPANKDKTYAEFRRRTLREKKYGKNEDEEEKTVPEIKPYVAHRQQEETIIGLPEEPAYESPYAKNADYAELSKYISTEKKDEDKTQLTLWERLMGNSSPVDRTRYTYEDPEYEYINRNEQAVLNREASDAINGNSFAGTDRSWLKEMTDEQIADYNYVYHTQGKEAASDFISGLEKDLTKSQMDKYREKTKEYAREHPAAASAASVLMGPMNALSLIGQIADYADDREIDPNAGSNKFTIGQKTIRETVPENWGKVGQFLYGTGMSVADNLYNMALTGAFGNVGGLGKGAETLVLGIMGSSAAANSTLEALENGYSSSRALLQGAIAGGIEALTEKISFETLLNPNAFADGSLKYILKNMLAEGSEEGMATLLNWTVDVIGDQITGQRLNEWARTYDAIAAANPDLSEAEIKRKMVGTMAGQLALDVAGGMLSGGLLAGGSSAVNLASNTMMGRNMNQSMSPDQISEYVNDSYNEISNDAASTPYQENLNERAMRQLRDNGRVNNRTLGELAQNIDYTVADRQNAENLVDLALARINAGRSVNGSLMNEIMKNDRAQNYLRDYGGLQELEGSYAEKAGAVNNALNRTLQNYDNTMQPVREARNTSIDRAQHIIDFADTFGEVGSRTLKAMALQKGVDNTTDLAESFARVYNAVEADPDTDLNELVSKTRNTLTPREIDTVFKAALADRETKLRKTGLEYGTEATKGEENGREERTEDLGVSEERYAGLAESVSVRSLEKRTAEIRERRNAAQQRRAGLKDNAAIRSIEEVTPKTASIPNGLDTEESKTVRTIPREKWSALDQDTYSLLTSLEKEGYTVNAWTGKAMAYDPMSASDAAVRGYVQGKTIGVRVDAEISPRQIVFHELFHDQVTTGSETQKEIVNKIFDHYGEERLRATIQDYVGQYGWTDASEDQILNEILADAYAGIDIYEDLLSYEGATQYTDIVRSAVAEGSAAGTIAGGNNVGQFSRETTSVEFNAAAHNVSEIREFDNYVNAVDTGILDFISRRTSTGRTSRYDFGKAGEKQVSLLRDLTGIDFSGYENSINASALNHIERRHGGGNNSADATMKRPEDIARIGYVINNADYAEYIVNDDGEIVVSGGFMDKNNKPSRLIRFVKKVDGHYVAVITAGENSRKKLRVVTAFMAKTKEAITRVSNADLSALHLTADTAHPSLASYNNISQEQVSGQEEFIIDPKKTSEIDGKVENGESLTPSEESQFSLEHDEEFAQKAERYNTMKGTARYVPASVMRQAIAQRTFVRELLTRDGMAQYLPEDKMGKTSFGNASYGMSMEHSTICPRTLSMEAILDSVSENFGRPLTVDESVRVSQLAWEYMDAPECAYCYVAMDRKAKREYRLNYLQSRDEVFRNLDAGMSEEEAYETFLNGRKDTSPMKKRFSDWIRLRENGADIIQMKDLASERSIQAAMKRGSGVASQIRDVEKYAQSASWAKKYVQYTAYNGEILKWSQDRINKLNAMYGLRMYSFSDFHPAFTLEDMQIVTDAAVRGLKVLAYTKELDFAKIMEPTGANINISVFAQTTRDQNGDFGMDAMQGADWEEAKALRQKSIENGTGVGITMVCVNDEQIDWALDQDWIDVVIPFHMVKTGAKVADFFGWKNYTDMQGDRKLEDWTPGENERMIEPPVHQNDKDLYFKALEDNHLSPRFAKWQDHQNYMKLVNETRVREADTPTVQPKFNTDAVEGMIDTMVRQGGYYQHAQYLGLDEDTFEGVTEDIADTYRERFGEPAQYSREKDEDTLDFLNNQNGVKVYRSMQVIDGKLYPPMAAKVDGALVEPTELGVWYKADERPDLIKNGKFRLNKGNGTSVDAAYNPYFHASSSPLNDQFSSAYKRENLVTVEGVIPESELTSGYRAEGAKDPVGAIQWHSGTVTSQLNKAKNQGPREIMLSRWFKAVRIVPDSEVADVIAGMFEGTDVKMPYKLVTPSLREELEKRNVPVQYSRETDEDTKEKSQDFVQKFGVTTEGVRDLDFDNIIHKSRNTVKGSSQFSRETSESTFDELFSTLEDGRIKPNNVADLSTEDWRLIYKAVNKLGYGMESVKQTKEVYSRYVGESGFNKEQSEAIKQAYGITENNSVPINPKREALARKTFGTTTDFREAGYLMRNGSMLDFSGKRDGGESGVRYMDHREIAEVFSDGEISDERTRYGNNTAYMDAFISEGNIRLMDGQGVTIGEMEPTSSQYTMLKRFIDHVLSDEDYFYLDLSNRDGYTVASRDYNSSDGSSRIVRDIKEYFKNGELPYKSDLQQFRFSRDTEETETEKYLKGQNLKLQRDLDEITKRYEHFKNQLTKTKVRTGTQKSAYRIAKNILSDYESGAETRVLRDGLLKASEALFNAPEDISAEELQTNMKAILMPYAADVINRSYGIMNEEDVKTQREIRSFLRSGSGIVVTDRMKSDVPNWNKFRQAQFGNMKLSSGTKTNVHEVYADLREKFGTNYFPEDIINESDMLQHVADVMADLAAIWDNPYTYGGKDAAEAVEACANDLLMELVNNIEEAPPTYADKAEEKLETARKEAIEAKNNALARVREQRDEALKKQAEHYQDRIKSMYDQRRMYELRSQIRKKVNDLGVKLIKPTDKQHVPQPLQGAVIDVLRQVNTGSTFDWARPYDGTHTEQGTGIPTRRTNAFIRLKDQLTELRDRLVVDQDLFDSEEGSGILSELALYPETSIDKLNVEQLDKVMIVLKSCENAIRTWNKMFNEGKYQEISEAAEAIYIENMDKKGRPEYARPIEMTKNLVSVDMLTPEAYFNRMGTSGRSLFKMLRQSQDQNIRILKEAQDFSKENGLYDLKLKDYEKKLLNVKFGNRNVQMSKAQLMELYILNKRDASRAHIQVGGILPEPVNEGLSLKKVTYNEPVRNVTQDDIAAAMANLTAEDIRIAEAMQQFVSSVMTAHGNEASMQVYGYEKFGEENYWPIRVNEQDLKTELGAVRVRARSVSSKGFTNAVKPNAKQSVMIGSIFDTFNDHVAEMANYSAWLATMEDMKRIYNFTEKDREGAIEVSTKYTIQNVFGQKGTKYFEKLMQDLSNGTVSEQAYFGGLMGKFKAAAVGSNLRVIVQQPTAIFRAMDMISPKYLAEGILKFNQGAKKAIEKAPIAQWKDWGYFDINTGRSTKNILFENSTTLDRVQNVLMSGAGKADSVAWGALYSAVEAETKALHPELDARSKAFDEVVVERFEDIIDHSQVVDGVLQRSALMRSENAIDKMATSFMGEPTKQFNMLTSAIYDYRYGKGDKKQAGRYVARTAAAMLFAGVLNAAVQSIMDAVRNDDPEKDYWEKFLEKFTGEEQTFASFFSSNLGDLVNPLQYIPYAKDIVSIAQGYDVERMDVSLINDLYTDGKSMVNALQGKGKYSLTNNIMNFTNTVAKFFGLSVGNVKRDAAGLLNTFAQNTGNYMMMYRMAKFTYNMNQSTNKGRFVTILAEAYENDREAYELILKDLVKEDRFATTTMTTYEWIRKRLKEKHGIEIPKE